MSLATKITGNLPFSILHRNGISWTKVLVRGWFLLNLRLSEGLEITKVVAAAVIPPVHCGLTSKSSVT